MKKAKTECESNCEVLGTDADKATHVHQISPLEADKASAREYTDWEKDRKGRGTK